MDPKRQRTYILVLAVAAVIAGAGLLKSKFRPGGDPDSATGIGGAAAPGQGSPANGPATPQRPQVKEKLPEIDPSKTKDAVIEEISDLSSQYSPDAVRPLAAYLYHSDPEVRDEARRGLVQLSEASAVPLLREAAKAELDPEESKKLTEAADFLALPEAKVVPSKKKK